MLIVVHRPDGLLQRTTSEDREGAPSYFELYSLPAHQALLKFVDERLSPMHFETMSELQDVLAEWESFYESVHHDKPAIDWRRLYIDPTRNTLVVETNGMGGDFVFAFIKDVKDITPSETSALELSA